ncbi:DUF6443 domain-containing protein [Chryseobacterium indoltheticum]|uniref:DUF6443 domain-containing protein n=1 Tax=Chryseobacterium indoltheticum TaxID=254 RepID=UPI00191146E2|nr:DUF6443 domain-containing protein [Chryseobacterium indoltheticum]QQQ27176.1 RHS repeat-associated core domain-containing protein [Chryseobacterium indoltheticum]
MKKLLFIIAVFVTALYFSQSLTNSENYTYRRSYLEPVTSDQPAAAQMQSVQYFDGLGRNIQSISIKATPSGKDMVVPSLYDTATGRQTKTYLPQPVDSQNGAYLPNIGENSINAYYGVPNAYSEVSYEQSPLARVEKTAAPGADWQITGSHTQRTELATNSADEVRKITAASTWNSSTQINDVALSAVSDDAYTTGGFYNANILIKISAWDEENREVQTFTDPAGKQILIRKINKKENGTSENIDTYYVYDDFGNLVFVIPPKAATATSIAQLNTKLDVLCYQYKYDKYNRLAEKKLPGKGLEYVVYDKQNRPVLTQDANLRTTTNNFGKRGWMFTKYDAFGRVLYTGFFANTGTRMAMQSAVNNMSANALNNETITTTPFTQGSMAIYYTKNAFPTGSITVLSINYYDEYPTDSPIQPDFVQNQATMRSAPTAFAVNGFSSIRSTQTMPTGSYTRNIENDSWSSAFIWYDTMGRAVGTYGKNHLGGFTSTETSLDFSGKVKETYTYHSRNTTSAEVIIKDRYIYSPYQFLQKHYQQINGQTEELISDLTYNDLGQITNKKVGGGLQSIDYTYNVRGWLLGINPNDLGTLGNKLFAYKIKYNQKEGVEAPNNEYTDLKVKPRYTGDIAEVDWKTATDHIQRRYGYAYDGINRLKAGFYQTDANPYLKEYNEILDYDLNGNISSLKRTGGLVGGTSQNIDDLTYIYDAGNRLNHVTDASQNYSGYPSSAGTLMDYDDNGNMTSQIDKGINSIAYNYLDLPEEIKFSSTYIIRNKVTGEDEIRNVRTNYVFRADGTKLRKEYTSFFKGGSERTTTTDYLDGFQYTVNHLGTVTLEFVPTSEGYYDFKNKRYIYNYADHLGNTRLSYFKNEGGSAEVLEENNYYPFGLKHEGYNALAGNSSYQYNYNGKELQEDTGMYDYGARFYMPDLGRWGVADPMAEVTPHLSSYHYANNNPIMFNDPTGMLSQSFIDQIHGSSSGTTWYNTGSGFSSNGGNSMDYDGNSINWSSGYTSQLLAGVGVSYGGGGDVAGEIRLPTLYLESNNAWVAAANIFLHHNASMERWNSNQAFQEKQRDWNFQMGNSSGRISMIGGAGDPFGIWEVAGMALAAKDKGNSNYILAALIITRSGNTGGLKVLNAAKGGMYIPKTPLAQHKVGGWDIPLPSPLAGNYPHTTLGGKIGSDGILYRQSATFTGGSWPLANGQIVPWSRVDWTTHGRPLVHPNPHQHVFNFNGKNWQYGKAVSFP